MVVIYCYLDKENCKVFKFPMNNFCYFEIGDSLFKPSSNKHHTSKPQISKTLWLNLGAQNRCSQNWPEWTPFSCPCILCAEFDNNYLLNDVKTKQFIIPYDRDMEWKFEKPTFKILISFQRKSRIIKYSLDLPLKNIICKHDALWTHAAYCVAGFELV